MKTTRPTKDYHPFLISTLQDPELAANYLSTCLADQDPEIIVSALNNVIEALAPQSIKKKLSSQDIKILLDHPERFNTLLSPLGLRLKFAVELGSPLKEAV